MFEVAVRYVWSESVQGFDSYLAGLKGFGIRNEKEDSAREQFKRRFLY